MLYQNRSCRKNVRCVATVAFIVCPLVFSSGCATTSSKSRKSASCQNCGCTACGAPVATFGETDAQDQVLPQTAAGLLQYESARVESDSSQWSNAGPPLPLPPEGEPGKPVLIMPNEPSCDTAARAECAQLQQQTEALRAQLQSVESHLANERSRQQGLNHSLAAVNAKVGTLSSELDYWKAQVRRIDSEAEQQHRDDLESLGTISELISRLPRPDTAAAGAAPRQ